MSIKSNFHCLFRKEGRQAVLSQSARPKVHSSDSNICPNLKGMNNPTTGATSAPDSALPTFFVFMFFLIHELNNLN